MGIGVLSGNWEIGIGIYNVSVNMLLCIIVLVLSNGGVVVNFVVGII